MHSFKLKTCFYCFSILLTIAACVNADKNNPKEQASPVGSMASDTTVAKIPVEKIDTIQVLRRNQSAGEYLFLLSDSLTIEDLQHIPPSILRLIRNEIFAKKGHIFKSKDLKDHFESTGWYWPMFENVNGNLTSLEKHNVSVLQIAENANSEISKTALFEAYLSYDGNPPKALCFLYDCAKMKAVYADEYMGGHNENYVLRSSKTRKYLLTSFFAGCDNCEEEYAVVEYTLEGKFVRNVDLGFSEESHTSVTILPDSLIFTNITRSLKAAFLDSAQYIDELEERYASVDRFYDVHKSYTLLTIEENGALLLSQMDSTILMD